MEDEAGIESMTYGGFPASFVESCGTMPRCDGVRPAMRRQSMTCMFFKRPIVFVMSASVIVAMAMSAKAQKGRATSDYTIRTFAAFG
jgi:hypothetical protein